ncbi:MAG: endopeptidase La [Spirochaetes bacterium]|nr:endopeptidase La [Spirochaetota bacterium]MBU1080768.1 endopeptidase La [Spirochaetota bacterium]
MSILDSLRPKGDATEIPLVYVRDAVVFPHTIAPILAATKFCVAASDVAGKGDKKIFISLLKNLPADGANDIDVHEVGTVAHVLQAIRLADGSVRLLVEGQRRARLRRTVFRKEYLGAVVEELADDEAPGEDDKEFGALVQIVRRDFASYAELVKKVPNETLHGVQRSDDPHKLCDTVANAMGLKTERKQDLLAVIPLRKRLEATAQALSQDIEVLTIQRKISQKVRARMDKSQKDYFLQEQIKEINKELGREDDENEFAELLKRIESKAPPKDVLDKAAKEIGRLSKLQALSPEAGVIRGYCEWLADLPWSAKTVDSKDLDAAKRALDEDHYGMKKAKERILEFIAVRQLNDSLKGPILCLVGPPGTGKTSLGRSIAKALGRDFVRMSLGGVRDEAEIRGHRKTYVGALPGKMLQSMRKAGTSNPVFLLDEIDKMSSDFRGDPASALLEVLDPEQNSSFVDHYLELPYDLSGVMFVTTANSVHSIPYALLDRMEIIEIPGYSEYEKLEIAKHFIVPKQISENGLGGSGLRIRDDAVLEIVRHYTMESGVRSLEREIARVVRKIAEQAVAAGYADPKKPIADFKRTVTAASLQKLLGKRRHENDLVFSEPGPGLACGLAWTEMGGTVLPVEASGFEGEGELILTGNLGDVMKESARAALTYLRAHAHDYGLSPKSFSGRTLHIHVPEGAIPKDGPSAGITLAAAIASALTERPLAAGWAMTGEITLTGRILAIGGVKEKILAAHRNKITKVMLPEANRKDIDDIPSEVASEMQFRFCSTIADAFSELLPDAKPGAKRPAKRPVAKSPAAEPTKPAKAAPTV